MTWPTTDVDTNNMDAGGDTPPRAEIKTWADKFNQMRNHVSAFAQTLLDDADAATARATLGASGPPLGYRSGFDLDFPAGGTTMTIGAGEATDSTGAVTMRLAAAITKTLGAWTVGSGNGSLDEGTIAASKYYHLYEIKRSDTGVVDVLASLTPPNTARTVTMTIASPCVVTETAHGRQVNSTVVFSTTGALPTGLTAGTTYYVISAGLATDSYRVSATLGGSAINTSGTQSGTHSVTSGPKLPTNYTHYRWIGFFRTNASSQFWGLRKRGDVSEWTQKKLQTYNYVDGTDVIALTYAPPGIETQASGYVTMSNDDNAIGATLVPVGGTYEPSEGLTGMGAALVTTAALTFASGYFEVVTDKAAQVYLIIDQPTANTTGYLSVQSVRDFAP